MSGVVGHWFTHLRKAAGTSQAPAPAAQADEEGASHSEPSLENDSSNVSSPFDNQPATPENDDRTQANPPVKEIMQVTSPIDIGTTSRNASSSPSSQGKKVPNYHDTDSRTSAMMSGTAFDQSMGRGRNDSFTGAKPISMNNPNRNADGRPRRESLAGSLVQGMSWGGVSVGSWIRDE
jgi:transcription factor SFP1